MSTPLAPALHLVAIDSRPPFSCVVGESVLAAMERAGRRDIPVGCRGGGCGVCKVTVLAGNFATGRMSRAQVTDDDLSAGKVLACRLYPRGDLAIAQPTLATMEA